MEINVPNRCLSGDTLDLVQQRRGIEALHGQPSVGQVKNVNSFNLPYSATYGEGK